MQACAQKARETTNNSRELINHCVEQSQETQQAIEQILPAPVVSKIR
ncbi:methyl-accepting chemotaxis protein [Vibrio cholerae]|nr:methyl-accepting chemotaxis protein [Vibrio cholerae]